MHLRYTLPLEIPHAIRFCKDILQNLDQDHLPIECYINAKTICNGIEGTFRTSAVICHRIEPERLDIFEDELLEHILDNCGIAMDGTAVVNCQITKMVFWVIHVKQLEKTCPECNKKVSAHNFARHLRIHDNVCGICQLVIQGDLEQHKQDCMSV